MLTNMVQYIQLNVYNYAKMLGSISPLVIK